jgi:transcriptional regulator with XRE-family HTH domain
MKDSDIIRQIRAETGLSQQKFADKIGVSFSIINKIEQDIGKIKYDLAKKLNEHFGYNIDALFNGELVKDEPQSKIDADAQKVLEEYIKFRNDNDIEAGRFLQRKINSMLELIENNL